jgi:hypothetical protein
MDYLLIAAVILVALALGMRLLPSGENEKKIPSGNCRNCPEFQYCGGGRPRCGRRSEIRK